MSKYENLWIVGIGASAGGFESIQKFLSNVSSQPNITYVITQHLDPHHSSNIGEILSLYSPLKVIKIKNNQKIESNILYYCPPNRDVEIKNGKFILTTPEETSYSKPSIDKFFTSLAHEKKDKAIGIILSGSGNDGANGVQQISKEGGIVLSEDKSAQHFYMPKAAINTGVVDVSLSSELLSEMIPNIVSDRNYFHKYIELQTYLDYIFQILNKVTHIDFSAYKEGTIIRRIEKRMNITKTNIKEYLQLLKNNKEEVEKLKNELLIVVTSFFRDKDAFLALKKELKELVKKERNNLRIWVPACATSEEVYSIAILLLELFEELGVSKKVIIFATDISDRVIEKARTKVFTKEEMSGVDKKYIDKYFDKVGFSYKVKKELRDMVIFSQHDIIKDPPFLNTDLISCRNLLIYFNPELQKRIFGVFYYSLKIDGLLFLGKNETIGNLNFLFAAVNSKYKIYRKSSDLSRIDIDTLIQKSDLIPKVRKIVQDNKTMDVNGAIYKTIIEIIYPNGIVIDKNYNILYYKGDCNEYLTHPQGLQSSNIFYLVKDYLKLDLRILINQAKTEKEYVKSKKIPIAPITNKTEYMRIEIFPLEKNTLGEETYFITCNKYLDDDNTENNINEYEYEIIRLKDKLQKTMESLEIANEELRVTNEELQSTNEELQSMNEELETSNEELQSTNEELQLVNEELENSNANLEFSNKVFNQILTTLNSSLLVLDDNLNVVKYTDGMNTFFDLSEARIKNFPSILVHSKIELPNLIEDIKICLSNDKRITYNIEYENKNYFFLIYRLNIPAFYKNNHSTQQGVVLAFIDKTEMIKKDKLLFQQSKMAAMGEMIGNIAHQWRQPLNLLSATIIEFSLNLREQCDEKIIDKFEDETNEIIQRMSQTIDDFRNFFRPNKHKKNFNIKNSINEAIKFTKAAYKDNNIILENNVKKDLFVNGFENELTQVILNILNNSKDAIKLNHIKDGKVVIDENEDENNINISIKDNGGGVEEEILSKIVEPYFTTKFKDEGTGLGLYMSKMIVDSMGGELLFENEDDGLKASIILPKAKKESV